MRKFSLWKMVCIVFVFCVAMALGWPAQTSTTLKTLHSFDGIDGANPEAGLVQATDGNFYGTTVGGEYNYGTVFSLSAGLARSWKPSPPPARWERRLLSWETI